MKRILVLLAALSASSVAMAQEAARPEVLANSGQIAIAAAFAIAIAAFGGALGQGKTATAALEGIARNPAAQGKIFTPMIIGLALIESLVIYAFVISFFLIGKF